ncbi:unnamed protein product [Rhizophagus irregularis]|nr:unnamed protein product [Rhizophagus irregularis]
MIKSNLKSLRVETIIYNNNKFVYISDSIYQIFEKFTTGTIRGKTIRKKRRRKNVPGPCTGAKFLQNTNDICHVIGMMYEKLLKDFNADLSNQQQHFSSIYKLHAAALRNHYIRIRFTNKLAVYGMRMWHISLLIDYKSERNIQVHRPYWNIRPDVPRSEQRDNAFKYR